MRTYLGIARCCCGPRQACDDCTHRKYDSSLTHQWSRNIRHLEGLCSGSVVDMVVRSSALYIVGMKDTGVGVVQKWGLDGTIQWSTDLAAGFSPTRVDSDGTQVWVSGVIPTSLGIDTNLYAYLSLTGVLEWSVADGGVDTTGNYWATWDVETDGAGGVYVARLGSDSSCTPNGSNGYVSRYDDEGTLLERFGGDTASPTGAGGATFTPMARSLLWDGTHLYVGSTQFCTDCDCNAVVNTATLGGDAVRCGHLAKFLAGEMVWLTGHTLDLPNDGYVNRLAKVGSQLFAGYYDGEDGCDLVDWNASAGELTAAYELSTASGVGDHISGTEKVHGLTAGTNFLAVASGGLLFKMTLAGVTSASRKHRGLNSNAIETQGNYVATAVDASDNIYAGGTKAGCTPSSDTGSESSAACAAATYPCECGSFGPDGGLVVSCGCDDTVPCNLTQPGVGSGCLACLASETVTWAFAGFDSSGNPTWQGTTPWCLTTPEGTLTITAIWDCSTEAWRVSAVVTAGGDTDIFTEADFTQTDEWCNSDGPVGQPEHPWVMGYFTVDAARAAAHPAIYPGCDGTGDTFGTDEPAAGESCTHCSSGTAPTQYTVTMSGLTNGSCGSCGSTFTLTFVSEHDGICEWTATDVFGCSGLVASLQVSVGSYAFLTFSGTAIFVNYELASFNCLGSNTLNNTASGSFPCNNLPATVTVAPA